MKGSGSNLFLARNGYSLNFLSNFALKFWKAMTRVNVVKICIKYLEGKDFEVDFKLVAR